jgi:hypothetical protein
MISEDRMTVTLVTAAILAALGVGFGAGWGLKPDAGVKALEAQTEAIRALQDGQSKMLENASKPIVIDAELRSTLANVPVQCRRDAGGSPSTVECQWATCLQFGQSSAQRPECRAVETLMVDALRAKALAPVPTP